MVHGYGPGSDGRSSSCSERRAHEGRRDARRDPAGRGDPPDRRAADPKRHRGRRAREHGLVYEQPNGLPHRRSRRTRRLDPRRSRPRAAERRAVGLPARPASLRGARASGSASPSPRCARGSSGSRTRACSASSRRSSTRARSATCPRSSRPRSTPSTSTRPPRSSASTRASVTTTSATTRTTSGTRSRCRRVSRSTSTSTCCTASPARR